MVRVAVDCSAMMLLGCGAMWVFSVVGFAVVIAVVMLVGWIGDVFGIPGVNASCGTPGFMVVLVCLRLWSLPVDLLLLRGEIQSMGSNLATKAFLLLRVTDTIAT